MAEQRIIETLVSLPTKEITLLWGVDYEVERLRNTVSTIKAVLLDAEEKQAAGSYAVKDWLGKLEDAMYDADDLLDAISTEALRREIMTRDKKAKQVRIFFSESNQLAFRHKMAHKIKAMRERLDAINADRVSFVLKVRNVETRVGNRERDDTHSWVRAEAVIGRDEDKKAVIDRLLDSNVEENVSILPIVGTAGLGKTTLAQLIFNDDQIQNHFELKMWVCVSDTFDVKNIVEKILEFATKEKQEPIEMGVLVGRLKENIDGQKYLLVLDDVGNEDDEKWWDLKELLMGGARGSRILVTTCNESVARAIRYEIVPKIIRTVQSYTLRGLNEDASWSLFKQYAFENGQEPENSSIEALGREILKKCLGVPLAIRTIGWMLASKNPEIEWLAFKDLELSKISHIILPTLKLSYDQLPSHLKHCVAYCCLYPKGYEIDRSTLIMLWIAQGFVKLSNQNQCLEEVGNEYFMDLLSRSFFQEAKTDEFGNVIRCKIFDLMHDLAKSEARSLITTLDDKERNISDKTRHTSLFGDCDANFSSISSSLYKASRMRTFLCLNHQDFKDKIDCDALFSRFKFLRVLELHGRYLYFVPSSIGKLKHLRYLDLSENNIKKLPNSITRLLNLQTLRLSNCVSLKELPRDIKKLVNLRHLEINQCPALTYMPRGLGQMTNLHTLSTFVVHSGSHSRHSSGLQELNRLNNLRGELVIRNLGHGKGVASEYKAANLKEKQHLHALYLLWSDEGSFNVSSVVEDERSLEGFQPHPNLKLLQLGYYLGARLPSCLLSLRNLVRFRLESCRKCQDLPPLSQWPSLKYLDLHKMDAMEYISNSGDSNEFSFPSLEQINLSHCPNLRGWWRREHHFFPSFPSLSTLSIENCPILTSIPMFPHLEEKLVLVDASSKLLQQTMMMNMAAPQCPTSIATTSHSSTPLSKLKSIELSLISDLETLPEEWFQNLISLKYLTISGCPRLKSLSSSIQHLTALQHLVLIDCLELEVANDEDGMQRQGLMSLLSLRFSGLPKLVSLPSWLRHSTTLQTLEISDCQSMTAIPEWIHNCKSLQVLEIRYCLSLASLPLGMRSLTSLQRLTIMDCPILLQRCKRDTGEDWLKIAHIPDLDLRYPPQQE